MIEFPQYLDKGTGPTIIFEHGTLMDATMFGPQIDYLAARGYRTVSHNSRVLTGRNVPHTLADLVEDTKNLIDELGLERVVLAGMSVGAFMAIDFAVTYPERLMGLVLINGKAQAYTEEQRVETTARFRKLDIDGLVPRDAAEWNAQYCFGPTTFGRNRALVDAWIARWTRVIPARSVWHQALSWINKTDQTARLSEIEMPVLIIHGEEDVPLPMAQAIDMLYYLRDATLVKVREVGHTSNLEDPATVNHALGSFMDRLVDTKA
jgi:pimeloyl-ACP methyl ester carboxylesterase